MISIALPASTIDAVLAAPTLLSSSARIFSLGISSATAGQILSGYNHGFRIIFLLNAVLSAFATVVSILMVKEVDLSREDDKKETDNITEGVVQQSDLEMGDIRPRE